MKQYFEQKYLPDYCYPFEAAMWRGFGALPDAIFLDSDGSEARRLLNEGDPLTSPRPFEADDFRFLGVEIDVERYLEARFEVSVEASQQLLSRHADIMDDATRENIQFSIAERSWADSMDQQIEGYVEANRAVVFEAMATGRLQAFGYRIPKAVLEDISLRWPNTTAEPIEQNMWSMKRFDWDECKLLLPSGDAFWCVHVGMTEVLSLWPTPVRGDVTELAGRRYGSSCLIVDDEGSAGPRGPQRRGPPLRGNLTHRDVVHNYVRKHPAPSPLDKVYIGEVQEFVQTAAGVTLPPTTIRDHIRTFDVAVLSGRRQTVTHTAISHGK